VQAQSKPEIYKHSAGWAFDLAGITNTWATRRYGIDRSNFSVLFSISSPGVAVDFRSPEPLSDNRTALPWKSAVENFVKRSH